jgi:hypothetical protein
MERETGISFSVQEKCPRKRNGKSKERDKRVLLKIMA